MKEVLQAIMNKKPVRVYIDQKDYVDITKGLSGHRQFDYAVDMFNKLLENVENGSAVVYFSWCHLVEALRYKGRDDTIKTYASVVDRLTKGNCIRFPLDLEDRELELFLAKRFGYPTALSQEDYPYGTTKDAFSLNTSFVEDNMLEKIKANIIAEPNDLKTRKFLLKRLEQPKTRIRLLKKYIPPYAHELDKSFPTCKGFYTKENILKLIAGSPEEKASLKEKMASGVCLFSNLLPYYQKIYPEFDKMAYHFDPSAVLLQDLIKTTQTIITFSQKQVVNVDSILSGIQQKFLDSYTEVLLKRSTESDFPVEIAKNELADLQAIPCRNVALLTCREYLETGLKGVNNGRTPISSDLLDIFHLMNLPYVDYFITDRFFSSLARRYEAVFHTKVCKSLKELFDTGALST